jgi:hypothetical protein
MRKHIVPILAVAAFLVSVSVQSCKEKDKDNTKPTEFVADNSTFSGFKTWTLEKTNKGPSPSLGAAHAGNDSTVTRKVYFKNGQSRVDGKYPIGTVIVKHSTNPAGTVNEITGMVKRGNGFNPTTGDWEWFMLNEDGTIMKDGGVEVRGGASLLNGMCNGCHGKASATDFTFSK